MVPTSHNKNHLTHQIPNFILLPLSVGDVEANGVNRSFIISIVVVMVILTIVVILFLIRIVTLLNDPKFKC